MQQNRFSYSASSEGWF